jgi:hypothetical protein
MLATLELHHPPQTTALIGMARVVSDGAFNAQIWDVIVDPAFQVGPELVASPYSYCSSSRLPSL